MKLKKGGENMNYWEEWKKKVDALEKEIYSLTSDETYDIDEDHHNERMRILEAKYIEYDRLIAESIPY